MTARLTMILGLCGSGKSHYIESELGAYDRLFEENFAHEDCFESNRETLIQLLSLGKHCVLSELKYLNPDNRDPFIRKLKAAVSDIDIDYICFENNLVIANSNCRLRWNKPDDPVAKHHIEINEAASPAYKYPPGTIPRRIHVMLPPPKPPAPLSTPNSNTTAKQS